jgi:cytochrome c oxidase subunit 3
MLNIVKITLYKINLYYIEYINNISNIFNKKVFNLMNISLYKKEEWNLVHNSQVVLPSHPYHIVDQSPWPILLSGVLLSVTLSGVLTFHNYPMGEYLLMSSFILLLWGMSLWFKDMITEASYLGAHTDKVQKGISLGVALFIVSEVFFFLSIFWAYFHSSLAPAIEIGSEWPPKGIEPVDASEVPTANTTILLSSGSAVTVSHHSLVDRVIGWANNGSLVTLIMALMFTALQGMEYFGVSYTITDSVFGSTFYMSTGWILGHICNLNYKNLLSIYKITFNKNKLRKLSNINLISPYWITGFVDGEGSFIIRIGKDNKRKLGWAVKPIFCIELHKRDLFLLEKIKLFFGVGTIISRKNRLIAVYSVQSVKNINEVIIPHFKKYSLITQKQADFKLFCMVINIINKKEHLNYSGLKKLINIRASMNKGLTSLLIKNFSDFLPVGRPIVNSIIEDPMWLTGFVDAEGVFYVKITEKKNSKPRVSLVFSISQHIRDLLLFKK